MRHPSFSGVVFCVLLLIAPAAARASDVLQDVPNDALGFVVLHKVGDVDAKAKWLSLEFRNIAFSPLAFLKTVTNVQDGLNPDGDFLVAVYPDPRGDKGRLRFGIWAPVSDYARFGRSIGASSLDGISTVTVAGEDLLVARRGEWAVVMDTDQRERMTQLVAAPKPATLLPQLATWKKWIDGNDVTVVAYASGVRELLSWVDDSDGDAKTGEDGTDDVFGAAPAIPRQRVVAAAGANRQAPQGLGGVLGEYRKWMAASPAMAHTIEQATMVACGVNIHLDRKEGSSAMLGMRVAFNDGFEVDALDAKAGVPNSLYDHGGFAVAGSGRLPKSVIETVASGYLRTVAADMKREERTELDEDSLQQLNEAVEHAAGEVRGFVMMAQPGAQTPPIYTNNYVALRVESAKDFVTRADEIMRLWNKANQDAEGETKLIFSPESTNVGERTARQFTLDFATMLGGPPAIPEVRQAMEKLFGPGGKLRLWVVPVDDHTVLLGQGTQEQVAGALNLLDRKQPVDWTQGELGKSNALLPTDADFRVFFDPHRYLNWERRQAMAVVGVPVIGGPLIRPFRDSPPVAIAGGFRGQELWVDAATLTPTLKSAYDYFVPAKRRPEIQLKVQRAPR